MRLNMFWLVGILFWADSVVGYPTGAPPGICSLEMMPNHLGHRPQTSPVPFDLTMSKDKVTSLDDTITVTIKSSVGGPPFLGFLVIATDKTGAPVGEWERNEWAHPVTSCSGTTHNNAMKKTDITLTWKPQGSVPDGPISMKTTIVERFEKFWVKIPISAKGTEKGSPHTQQPATQEKPTTTSTPKPGTSLKGGVALPGLSDPKVSTIDTSVPKTLPTTTMLTKITSIPINSNNFKVTTSAPKETTVVPTTKRRSFIDKLLRRGGTKTVPSTSTKTLNKELITSTAAPSPIKKDAVNQNKAQERKDVESPTTTTNIPVSTTTTKPGFFKRVFGGH